MKKTLLGLVAVATLAGSAAFAADKTETLKVSGWHCGGCSAKRGAAFLSTDGAA